MTLKINNNNKLIFENEEKKEKQVYKRDNFLAYAKLVSVIDKAGQAMTDDVYDKHLKHIFKEAVMKDYYISAFKDERIEPRSQFARTSNIYTLLLDEKNEVLYGVIKKAYQL